MEENKEFERFDRWAKFKELIIEYSEYSTIAGVVYIFMDGQTIFGKIYWSFWTIFLFSLGTYWSIQAYNDWQGNLVITTAKSTAVPVGEVDFPGVVLCTQGLPTTVFHAAFLDLLMKFLTKTNGQVFDQSAIEIVNMIVYSTLKEYNIPNNLTYTKRTLNAKQQAELKIGKTEYIVNGTNAIELMFEGVTASAPNMLVLDDVVSLFRLFTVNNIYAFMNSTNLFDYWSFIEKNKKTVSPLTYFFNSTLMAEFKDWSNKTSHYMQDVEALDMKKIFTPLLTSIWYSRLPCFDQEFKTAELINDASFLKGCQWKGMAVNCSAIFKALPTDNGMCCSFNMAKADEIYVKSKYGDLIQSLQNEDYVMAMDNQSLPQWYIDDQEPSSKAGTNMGLQVTLDAHSDLLSAFSIESDYDSFTVLISAPGDFPMTIQKGFRALRGFHNMVALSATIISGDADIKNVAPLSRGCLMQGEYQLKLYQQYSQVNCLFECTLNYAQKKLKAKTGYKCTPWYFPFLNNQQRTCYPWEAYTIANDMAANVDDSVCAACLPDCEYFLYTHSLSTEPFRACDDFNFGISPLCDLDSPDKNYKPPLWGAQVIKQLRSLDYGPAGPPAYIDNITTNIRHIYPLYELNRTQILENTVTDYDAYDRDISVVSVYFDTPTVWHFSTQTASTWIIYFSNVGGLYGLCIGFSLATVVELVWLGLRIFSEMKFFESRTTKIQSTPIESIDLNKEAWG